MYLPEHFREARAHVLHALARRHPLAVLVAHTPQGLTANHIPLLWLRPAGGPEVLRGHVARANPLWRLVEPGADVLALFTAAEHYISPSWYVSKQIDGKVVPTWNYAAVHVHGSIRFIEDLQWLRALVEALTDEHERGQPHPWQVSDAPDAYVHTMLRAVVGFEVTITSVEGKFKGSQNRSPADRRRVADALRTDGLSVEQVDELLPGLDPR